MEDSAKMCTELDYDVFDQQMKSQPVMQTMPYCKAINNKAGLFIPNDCMEKAEWIGNSEIGVAHIMETEQLDINGEMIVVPGRLVKQPKMVIVRRSPFLRYNKDSRRYDAVWNKIRDTPARDRGEVQCALRYLVMFLNENNELLHMMPFQLSLKGHCMFKFDVKYKEFICHMMTLKSGKTVTSVYLENEANAWIASHCIFCPEFKSEKVGEKLQSFACITTTFTKSELADGSDLYLSRSQGEIVLPIFFNNKNWYTKSFKRDDASDNDEDTKIVSEVVDI
jgi:hypothetical protein